VEKLVHNIF